MATRITPTDVFKALMFVRGRLIEQYPEHMGQRESILQPMIETAFRALPVLVGDRLKIVVVPATPDEAFINPFKLVIEPNWWNFAQLSDPYEFEDCSEADEWGVRFVVHHGSHNPKDGRFVVASRPIDDIEYCQPKIA